MRPHHNWPWRYAFAAHNFKNQIHESRWHGGGRNFGVRRPLRYLAFKLELDDAQTRKMATVLNQLKTEKEQAGVDEKRTVTALAGLLESGTPSREELDNVLQSRTETASRMNDETARAVIAISELLDDDQRGEFVNLLLTGAFTL